MKFAEELLSKPSLINIRRVKALYYLAIVYITNNPTCFHRLSAGDAADGMYFIEDGKVSIRIQQDAGEVEISMLEKGQYFGELALVTHRPRAASAYAVDNVKVACKYPGGFPFKLDAPVSISMCTNACVLNRFTSNWPM